MKLKYFTRTIAVGLFGAIALVGTQLLTTIQAVDQARESAILAWYKSNPGDAEAVERYGVWGAMEPKTNVSPTNAFRCLLPRRPSRQNSCACRPPG